MIFSNRKPTLINSNMFKKYNKIYKLKYNLKWVSRLTKVILMILTQKLFQVKTLTRKSHHFKYTSNFKIDKR